MLLLPTEESMALMWKGMEVEDIASSHEEGTVGVHLNLNVRSCQRKALAFIS